LETIQFVKAFVCGDPDSLAFTIPKQLRVRLNIKRGKRYAVKLDSKNRIVYDPITAPIIAPKEKRVTSK